MFFKITNLTHSTEVAKKAGFAQDAFSRAKGLLGRSNLAGGEGLIITSCNSIHTFFMKFSIDVIFVNKENRVVRAIESIKPFRLSPVVFGSNYVIELPVGVIQSSLTQKGDQLELIEYSQSSL